MTAVHLDFETFSLAGVSFDLKTRRFISASAADGSTNNKGIALVGAFPYAAHPSADVLVACYDFRDGAGVRKWVPGGLNDQPADLLDHVRAGGTVVAFNSFFEWCVWNLICVRRYGWPPLPIEQTRDAAAYALAYSLPGSLEKSTAAYFGKTSKNMDGNRVMLRLSQGRTPTKNDNRIRFERRDCRTAKESENWIVLDEYCAQDVEAEASLCENIPPLSLREFQVWLLDQRINARGVYVDSEMVEACLKIVREGKRRADTEIAGLTAGAVTKISQATTLLKWVNSSSPTARLDNLEPKTIGRYLENNSNVPDKIRATLELRLSAGGNATAKPIAMKHSRGPDGRARGLYQYAGAQRTRRWAGRGVQPQNLPNSGPDFTRCETHGIIPVHFPCDCPDTRKTVHEWDIQSVRGVETAIESGDYDTVASWGDPLKIVSGYLRSLITAGPGNEFISSDYSAIEAVVMACLAGESWMIDVFFGDGKLYEHTGSQITGVPVADILAHKRTTGTHHPARKLGKVASLASQYQGARGAWLAFGAGKFLTNDEIDDGVLKWRKSASAVVAFWRGCDRAAMGAVKHPGVPFPVYLADRTQAPVHYIRDGRALRCVLPNEEDLTYLDPEIVETRRLSADGWAILREWEKLVSSGYAPALRLEFDRITEGYPGLAAKLTAAPLTAGTARNMILNHCHRVGYSLAYMGAATIKGRAGTWTRIETYGGKLAENIVQATARFILSEALLRVENAGYPVVMHTHDEITAEVPAGHGSVEEFERVMSTMPPWARLPDGRYWPIQAAGGWRGRRYRK